MIKISTLTEADFGAAGVVLDAAYDGIGLTNKLKNNFVLQPDGWFCAWLDEQIVGVGGAIDYGAFASIGMIAVHPTAQRRGIGLKLMQHLIGWLDSRQCPISFLDATIMGAPLYEQLGFVDDGRTLRLERLQHTPTVPPYVGVRKLDARDLAAVIAFDTPIFGAERSRVLKATYNKHPDRAFVAQNNSGAITGYLFAQTLTIGPWSAQTPQIAERLLQAALSLAYNDLPAVILPASNTECKALVERYGFMPDRNLRHMRRGGTADPRNCSQLYGLTGFALG